MKDSPAAMFAQKPRHQKPHIQQHHGSAGTVLTGTHTFSDADEKFQLMPTSTQVLGLHHYS